MSEFLDEVRAFYDALAPKHHARMATDLAQLPMERAALAAFAELVGPGARVLDAGCGPGKVTAHLAGLGIAAEGLDLSPVMLDLARAAFPDLSFRLGSLTALDVLDGSLDGILSWYSLIHIPPAHRLPVMSELHRVLVPGGFVLLAFQVGDDVRHVVDPDGSDIALDFHRLDPDTVIAQLAEVGFELYSLTVRPAVGPERSGPPGLPHCPAHVTLPGPVPRGANPGRPLPRSRSRCLPGPGS